MYSKWFQISISRRPLCVKKNILCKDVREIFHSDSERSGRTWHCLRLQTSNFHTTQKLRYPQSIVLCFGSIVCGHYIRKWWLKQDSKRKEMYIGWYKQRRLLFQGSLGFVSIIFVLYCLSCIQRDPILKIPRFVLYETKQMESAKILYNSVLQTKENVVPLNNPMYLRVAAVIRKLGNCNREIFQDTEWKITIIRRMFNVISAPNVFILPDKNIIIASDIFNYIKSNDQLMFILAHEMSHEMLLHTSEKLSWEILYDIVATVSTFLATVRYSKTMAAMVYFGMSTFSLVVFSWYSRRKEAEADAAGITLAAKSCIDVREVLVFWKLMKMFEEFSGQDKFNIPIFMQHPSLDEREKRTMQMIPKAMKLRQEAKCPPLPARDPQDLIPMYKKDIEKHLHKGPHFLGMKL